jgi:hypothetical protein
MKVNLSFMSILKWVSSNASIQLLLAFLVFGAYSPVFAQKDSVKTYKEDRSTIEPRYPAPASLDKYRNDRAYSYEEGAVPTSNPLDKWVEWLMRKINNFFASKSYDNFWQYIIMAITAALVLYLLYKAKVLDYVFPSRNTADTLDYVVGQENIHEINFEQAIGSALEQGDFRLAIRLQYLKILKLLTVKELIHWKPNLTNQSYVQELEKTSHHSDFTEITRYFEFAWYGDFEVSEDGFKEMKAFSDSFVRKVGA